MMFQQAPRFLVDQMCAQVGRWLRASGYDTVIIETSLPDESIFQSASSEKRLLITRDRDFKKIDPEEKQIIYLLSDDMHEAAIQLKKRGVDWLYRPFTRCLECNSLLENHTQETWLCPACKHIFWRGSHTENMERQMKVWKEN